MRDPSAPRSAGDSRAAVEEQLALLWSELLDRDVAPEDSFFEVGGYSLLAVQMVNRLRERGFELTTSDVFAHETLAGLADFLTGAQAGPSSTEPTFQALWSAACSPWAEGRPQMLIPLAEGQGRPVFWVHWATGNIRYLERFATELGAGRPMYGLRHPSLARAERPPISFGELAERYVAELLTVQPSGPFTLFGLCSGGLIALEMASRLTAAGRSVSFLGLVNATAPPDLSPGIGMDELYRMRVASLRDRFDVTDLAASASEVLLRLQAPDTVYYDQDAQPKDLLWYQAVWAATSLAELNHQPRPYPGRVVVFQKTASVDCFDAYWRDIVPAATAETFDVRSTLPMLDFPLFQHSVTRHLHDER